jgi:formate-dependent nitrite reductase cytochrome c552 subunit
MLPQLGDQPFQPDGRVRTFAYQQGHLYSDCYLKGRMTCTTCHDPHAQSYRDVNGAALAGRFADGQCTGCHASKSEPVEAHTKHAAASAGSRCVNCHMPYIQHPELGGAVRYARSDHSIPIPRPAFDSTLGAYQAGKENIDSVLATETAWLELEADYYGFLAQHIKAITDFEALQRGARAGGNAISEAMQ